MNDTEYHSKIKRLPLGQVPKTHRELMSDAEMKELLTGEVFVEEKLDGALEATPAYDRPGTIFTESLRVMHSICYDQLPAWHIVLDVADDHVNYPDTRNQYGPTPPLMRRYLQLTPSIFQQQIPFFLERRSGFAKDSPIEGIVIKNYQKQLFGKVVNMEFYKGIEKQGSYLKRRRRLYNRLTPGTGSVQASGFE